MSTLTSLALDSKSERLSMNWIVDQKADLLWFIGGSLTAYAMLFLHAGLHVNMVMVWFLWVMFLDSPHFFGTYLRTYFDREEFQARKKLLIGSLGWLLVGPAAVGLSYLLYRFDIENYNRPFFLFLLFFNLWAYWHVVRQHFGILSLYKKKNNDFDAKDNFYDKTLLYGGLLAPFVAFAVRHPEARKALGLTQNMPELPTSLSAGLSAETLKQLHWEHYVVALSVTAFSAFVLMFAYRQYYRWRQGLPVNMPKLLFMVALIPLYAFICYSSSVLTAPLMAFSIFVTIYHDVQYHAIVWFYAKNRYHKPGVDSSKYGLAAKMSKNFGTYMLSGIAMAAIFRLFGCGFEVHPGCGPIVLTSHYSLFGDFTITHLLYGFLIGLPLQHYFIDQYIWRPSKDKVLQKDLKL